MIPRNSKVVLLLSSVMVLGLTLLFSFGLYRIASQHRKANELAGPSLGEMTRQTSFQSLRAIQNISRGDVAILEKAVVSQDKTVAVLESLERAGRSLGTEVKITSVERVESLGTPATGGLKVDLDSRGTWSKNFALLRAVESLPYRVIFKEVSLVKEGSSWVLGLSILLPTFN